MTTPNIILLSNGELYGGAERQIMALAEGLRRKGISVSLLLLRRGKFINILKESGIPFVCLDLERRFSLRIILQLRKLINSSGKLVLHTHGYQATVYGILASLLTKETAVVRTSHGRMEFEKRCSLENLLTLIYAYVESFLVATFRIPTVYVTHDLANLDRIQRLVRNTQHVIYNGLNLPERNNIETPKDLLHASKKVLIIGRLTHIKGINIAIKALKKIPEAQRPTLFVIGDGDMESKLKAQVAKLSLNQSVNFLGFKDDILPYLQSADALLIPSFHEGLPYVLIEALASKIPVICSQVGGMSEVLTEGKSALLFPKGDHDTLSQKVVYVLNNRENISRITTSGFELYKRHFTEEAMIDEYLQFYNLSCDC